MKRYYDKSLKDSIITVIDIETVGIDTKNGSPILTVGLFSFRGAEDPCKDYLCSSYFGIKQVDFEFLGIKPDLATLDWWEKRPQDLYKHTFEYANHNQDYSFSLIQALGEISDYLEALDTLATAEETNHFIVGNSPEFDQGMLNVYFDKLGLNRPWKYYQNLDLRSLMTVFGNTEDERKLQKEKATQLVRTGSAKTFGFEDLENLQHTAIYDAVLEAIQISDLIKKVNKVNG